MERDTMIALRDKLAWEEYQTFNSIEEQEKEIWRDDIQMTIDMMEPRQWLQAEDYAIQRTKSGFKWVCRYTSESFTLGYASTIDMIEALGVPIIVAKKQPRTLHYDKQSLFEDRIRSAEINGVEPWTNIWEYRDAPAMNDRYEEKRILPHRWEIF